MFKTGCGKYARKPLLVAKFRVIGRMQLYYHYIKGKSAMMSVKKL